MPTDTASHFPSDAEALRRKDGRPLRVAIDGFNLSLERGTGVATYGRNLARMLKDAGAEVDILYGQPIKAKFDDLLKEVMFFDMRPPSIHKIIRTLKTFRAIGFRNRHTAFRIPVSGAVLTQGVASRLPPFDRLWNAYRVFDRGIVKFDLFGSLQRVRLPDPPDVMHWTYPLPVCAPGVPNIYTVHDLVPLRLPYTTLDHKGSYVNLMRWIARTADHIVTVSEASKRDIVKYLGVPEDRVTNTYQAVHLPRDLVEMSDDEVANGLAALHGLEPRSYFLFFGAIEPKKNIGRIVEAFLSAGTDAQLIIVGTRGWRSVAETRLLEDPLAGERRVRRIDYLPFPQLVQMIRGARAVVFPSLYEGFGLPVLEAMALGTPVISSNTSSVPEVAGDAALLVDPYSTAEIAQALRKLDQDDDLCFELAQRGRRRAELFSEAAYAGRLRELYRRVSGGAC